MNSKERHEARYQRRVAKREAKRKEKFSGRSKYDDIFTFEKLYNSFYQCREGVRWKKSVQTYEALHLFMTLDVFSWMKNRKFNPMGFLEFNILERGKLRHIRAVHVKERCIQKVLCDDYLIPRIEPKLIYDNGASIKGKGTSFAIKRMKRHLLRHYRKYGNHGYIFQYDFSSYFDNIDHQILLRMLYEIIDDPEIFNVASQMITCFGEKGLGLGSQISQICAVWYPTLIDRYFKENLCIQGYARYNDDGYAICTSLAQANACKEGLIETCKELNIKINEKKLKITPINKTFIFLKKRFLLTDTGKIITKIDKSSVTRARRKMKRLAKRINQDNFTLMDFTQSYKSWMGMAQKFDNYIILKNHEKLYYNLLHEYDCGQTRRLESNGSRKRIRPYKRDAKNKAWPGWKAHVSQLPAGITPKQT